MKKINLRDYYPYYTQDMIVEVPDEVADILREYKLAEAAYFLRTYRHKAYFSLDYDINVEHEAKMTAKKYGQTIVMITHDDEIAQVADRILVIEDGQVVDFN